MSFKFVFGGWSHDGSFSVCRTDNASVLCNIRVTEDASGGGSDVVVMVKWGSKSGVNTPMHGGLNIDDTDKSFGRSLKETKEKGLQTCGATDEIVLRPKGILGGLAGSSRLGAYDAVRGDFLEFCPIIRGLNP